MEDGEAPAEAAVREAREETGLDVTIVPGPSAALPAAFPHRVVPAPWLTAEVPAAPDRHTNEHHVHVDHVYVAVTVSHRPKVEPEHHVRWFTAAGIAGARPSPRTPGCSPPSCSPSSPRSQAPGFA